MGGKYSVGILKWLCVDVFLYTASSVKERLKKFLTRSYALD